MNEIKHKGGRFYLENDESAVLDYRLENDNVMRITHTYVPNEMRGKGIARKLVLKSIDYAKEKNFKINPVCSYVRVFFDKNKEFKDLLA